MMPAPRSTRAFVLLLLSLGAARGATVAQVLVFPQFVTGGGYVSTISLVNTNFSAPVAGTLEIFNQNGTPRQTTIEGRPTGASFTVTIPAGGSVTLTTGAANEALVVGMARFTSDFPAGGVVRFEFAGGQVGVLSAVPLAFATLPLNTASGNDTGLAICNPGTAPLNLRLVHVSESGQVLQIVDPPELNPLAGNGQVAKFIRQFGFTQADNRAGGSIQIENKGAGTFCALALLQREGLSSTAVVPGVSGKFTLGEFNRKYDGIWRNTTFGSQGEAFLTHAWDKVSSVIVVNIAMTGNVFGSASPSPVTLTGTFNLAGFTARGSSSAFGTVVLTVGVDGAFTLDAGNVPGAVATMRITGTAHPDRITGTYVVTFDAGGSPANGTITLDNSGPF